jgi:hypothetical protein
MLRNIFGGKGAVSNEHINTDELDQEVAKEVVVKPAGKAQVTPHASEGHNSGFATAEETPSPSHDGGSSKNREKTITKEKAAAAQSIVKPIKEHSRERKNSAGDGNDGDYSDDGSGTSGSDVEPVDVLLQFIPYYGQGDPANDSIVRSTLSALSVEDIDSQDEYGNTLLLLACQYRCEDLVRIMLNKGADANAVNSSGACCLHFACYRESASINVAKILLKSGADPDVAESTFGCTPLHYCAGTGDIEFCKLLLSYGAQIGALDYYNYTCVDYATEAGMADVAAFLQKKLDAEKSKFGASMSIKGGMTSPATKGAAANDMSNWEAHIDPDSGGKYYIHSKTGECLWEAELKQRLQSTQSLAAASRDDQDGDAGRKFSEPAGPKISEADLIKQAFNARLVVFFSTHDPSRLVEVDSLLNVFAGRETQLLKDLCEKYKVDGGPEVQAFEKQINDLRPTGRGNRGSVKVTDLDPLALQDLTREERKRFEQQLEEETTALRKKYEAQIEEEKTQYIHNISEKEGTIAKLKAQIESLDRGKNSTEEDIRVMQEKLNSMQLSGGEQVTQLQAELEAAQKECRELKKQLAELQQTLNYEREKLKSLEATMSNLASGNEELIAREQQAAEERAAQQREREAQHNQEMRTLEDASKNTELRLKTELNHVKQDFTRKADELKDQQDQMRKAKDREIDKLARHVLPLCEKLSIVSLTSLFFV